MCFKIDDGQECPSDKTQPTLVAAKASTKRQQPPVADCDTPSSSEVRTISISSIESKSRSSILSGSLV